MTKTKAKKSSTIHASGKRKTAIARATLKPGNGNVRVNGIDLKQLQPSFAKAKISEPFMLAGGANNIDVNIKVIGTKNEKTGVLHYALSS